MKFIGLSKNDRMKSDPDIVAADESLSPHFQNLIHSAKQQIETGQIDAAIDILIEVLGQYPSHVEANAIIGACLMADSSPDLAEGFLYTAVRLSNWTDIISVGNLVECLRLNDDSDLAIQVAMRGLSSFENSIDPSGMIGYILGNIYAAKLDFRNASDWYLASALQQKSNIEAWLKASTVLFPSVDFQFAENVLIEGIRYNPGSDRLLFEMGLVLHQTTRVLEAIPFYLEAVRINPELQDALPTLATALHAVGRFDEALEAYRKADTLNRNNVVMLANYAILLKSMGHAQQSAELIARAKVLDPQNADVLKAELFTIAR